MILSLSSCEKDETKITATQGAAPTLTASATSAKLSLADANKDAVTYSWTPVTVTTSDPNAKVPLAPSYTLQLAVKGTNFAAPKELSMNSTDTKRTLTVREVNTILSDLNVPIGQPTELEVRLKSMLTTNVQPNLSAVSTLSVTRYDECVEPAERWGIIGDATPTGWGSDTDMKYDCATRTWSITIALTDKEFKFRANDDWPVNLGDNGADGSLEPNGANIKVPAAGTYKVTLDVAKKTYTLVK